MPYLRAILRATAEDLDTVVGKDPSVHSRLEAMLHPHIAALWLHRAASGCYRRNWRIMARLLALTARFVTGIEIHPGARIGRRFFIDHGAAVVIGETAVIGDDVMLYHQVTLGSVGWWKDREHPGAPRHPRLEDDVIVGTNASVLGAVTVGRGSRIGAHSILSTSVPPWSRVTVAPTGITYTDGPADVLITGESLPPGPARTIGSNGLRPPSVHSNGFGPPSVRTNGFGPNGSGPNGSGPDHGVRKERTG